MSRTPRDRTLDSSLALLREGYTFLPRRLRRHRSDVFQSRLFGRRAIWLHGPEAARLFYDQGRFERRGALPGRVQKTLTGEGGLQSLDGAAHASRKQMFMRLMTPSQIEELVELVERAWQHAVRGWELSEHVVLFDEVERLLCRAVCAWAGVPLPDAEVNRRAGDLGAMVDALGAAGRRHWRGRLARRRSEAWIGAIVDAVRGDRLEPPAETAVDVIAHHRDPSGRLLDRRVAAVEVLNVLRPVVAISTYITFVALALHRHPEWKDRIRDDEASGEAELFVEEVRRFYPFAPFVGARVRSGFEWRGHRFEEGDLALVDVYGAHHDDELWDDAGTFDPDRFRTWTENSFDFIPQGGGDHFRDHRCAGEWLTIAVMKSAARLLTQTMEYEVSEQDLRVDLRRIPTRPASGFVISRVRSSGSGTTTAGLSEGGTVPTTARNQSLRPEPRLLGIYLNDHLAGATAGVARVRRLAGVMRGSSIGEPLARLAEEISDDRAALMEMMAELDVPVRRYKLVAATAAERLGRMKPNGHLVRRSPLTPVEELDMLRMAIEGKAAGWRTLRTVGTRRGEPDPQRLDDLIERANRQTAVVEALKERTVAAVFGIPEKV